jgi:N-acetylglucosaminyldiphosphoundecaprenol N-acetyl-beta-D-mannosaminyltransferase
MKANAPTVDILGVPVNPLRLHEVLDLVDDAIKSRNPLHIGVVNAAKIVNMSRDIALRDAVLESDIILADGVAVVLAGKMLGKPLPERVTGIDLMFGILARGNKKHYRVYCLGATAEISERIAQKMAEDFPGVVLAGRRDGYFNQQDEETVAREIAQAKPDVLFVAITSPKKERFMAQWSEVMQVPVVHGVGGSFDVMAGKVARAPMLWQKMGLEWLYRVLQEPRRLWKRYLVTNTAFCWLILKEVIRNIRIFSAKV